MDVLLTILVVLGAVGVLYLLAWLDTAVSRSASRRARIRMEQRRAEREIERIARATMLEMLRVARQHQDKQP